MNGVSKKVSVAVFAMLMIERMVSTKAPYYCVIAVSVVSVTALIVQYALDKKK